MKVNLTVLTAGKWEGKTIPIAVPQFLIGRDPQCHLRPASPTISTRHCALVVRGHRVFVHDFGSTNGTFVNDRQIKGEFELQNEDRLTVGPLTFAVSIESSAPARPLAPQPAASQASQMTPPEGSDDDSVAAMLLFLDKDKPEDQQNLDVGAESTVVEANVESTHADKPLTDPSKTPKDKSKKDEPKIGDTSSAAKVLLDKYIRRPR